MKYKTRNLNKKEMEDFIPKKYKEVENIFNNSDKIKKFFHKVDRDKEIFITQLIKKGYLMKPEVLILEKGFNYKTTPYQREKQKKYRDKIRLEKENNQSNKLHN